MSEKPEALRLAERIDLRDYYDFDAALHCPDAAIELRRLHAENERLRDELRQSSIDITRAEVERLKAENERLRELLLDIRKDAATSHWHRDIDAAMQEDKR